jgi:anhydro-N-acetylmuramic acid kinase
VIRTLIELNERRELRVIGLMSGTSADGVDAALLWVKAGENGGAGPDAALEWKLLGFETFPFTAEIRNQILALQERPRNALHEMTRLHFTLGEIFSEAAIQVATRNGLGIGEVDLIGSHGQTVCHMPRPRRKSDPRVKASLQIGEPCVIAERTGVPTVANFRARDIAAGGEGAPLVPFVDYLLFRSKTASRVLVNLGGIGNITAMPKGGELKDVIAFDTGPGNMVIDALASHFTDGREVMDRDGALASRGKVNLAFLEELISDPFFDLPPPKSTGRDEFGTAYALRVIEVAHTLGLSDHDLMATVTHLSAKAVHHGVDKFVRSKFFVDEVIVSGGGCHNQYMMRGLQDLFQAIPVRTTAELGLPVDAKEAAAFALLAHATIRGHCGNLPSVTGAKWPVPLGVVVPGRR